MLVKKYKSNNAWEISKYIYIYIYKQLTHLLPHQQKMLHLPLNPKRKVLL